MASLAQRLATVEAYQAAVAGADDPAWIRERAAAAGLPAIEVAPEQGRFLAWLVRLLGARRVLEVGTLAGYSATWMARELPPGGCLVTIEAVAIHADLAAGVFAEAGLDAVVDLRTGRGREVLAHLGTGFDLAFFDADKTDNPAYLEWVRSGGVRSGGIAVFDNVLRDGAVAAPADAKTRATDATNRAALAGFGADATILPFVKGDLVDGMLLVRVG